MKNWKTTLIGLGIGFGYAFLSALSGGLKPKDALVAGGIAALGAAAKDSDVTGVGENATREP